MDKKIIELFEKVRDVPYGDIGSRDPEEVLKKNMGTCSGKHELLKKLLNEIGIETKYFVAMHRFKDLPVPYPEHLKKILERSDILDPHNFLKIKIDGNWITVDATWDKSLKKFGFPVNENWDGKSDMQICVEPLEIIEVSDPIAFKEQKLAELPEAVQADRKIFLQELSKWLAQIR